MPSNFTIEYPFTKPIHILIMVKIIMVGVGSARERIIDGSIFPDFCCCSKYVYSAETVMHSTAARRWSI